MTIQVTVWGEFRHEKTNHSIPLTHVPDSIQHVYLLGDGQSVESEYYEDKHMITISENRRDPLNTVVVLM